MDPVLIGAPDTVTALSLQFGVERVEELHLFRGEERIVAFEQVSVRLSPSTLRPLVQLGTRPEYELSFVWKLGHTSITTTR